MAKAKPKDSAVTAALLVEELDISPELLSERWPNLKPETVLNEELESRIRHWAADLHLSSERREFRRVLALRLLDCDRQNAALDEIDRLLALAHTSEGLDLPKDLKEAAFIKTIYEAEKKLQGRMDGHLSALADEVYINTEGEIIRPSVAIQPTQTRRYDSPALPENSEALPALTSPDN